MKKSLARGVVPMLMILPAALLIGIVFFTPIFQSIDLSFYKWNGIFQCARRYVGVSNYERLFKDRTFWISMRNVGLFLLQGTLIQGPIAFILAIFISKKMRAARYFKFTFFLPVVIPLTAIGLMWKFILNPNWGVVNAAIQMINPSFDADLIGDPNLAMYSVVLVSAWVYIGLNMVIFSSGMTAIPNELYESADIDGASGSQKTRYITLPMLMESIKIYIILMITGSLKTFDLVYVMTNGGPNKSTMVPALMMYQQTFTFGKFGYGAAVATFILVAGLLGSIIANKYLFTRE